MGRRHVWENVASKSQFRWTRLTCKFLTTTTAPGILSSPSGTSSLHRHRVPLRQHPLWGYQHQCPWYFWWGNTLLARSDLLVVLGGLYRRQNWKNALHRASDQYRYPLTTELIATKSVIKLLVPTFPQKFVMTKILGFLTFMRAITSSEGLMHKNMPKTIRKILPISLWRWHNLDGSFMAPELIRTFCSCCWSLQCQSLTDLTVFNAQRSPRTTVKKNLNKVRRELWQNAWRNLHDVSPTYASTICRGDFVVIFSVAFSMLSVASPWRSPPSSGLFVAFGL